MTQRNIYKEKPLHRAAFKQRKHRATITQRNFRTDRAAFAHPTILTQNFYKHVFLHTNVLQRDFLLHQEGFAQRNFFTHSSFYTQTLVHIEILIRTKLLIFYTHTYIFNFTQRNFHTQMRLHTDSFTPRRFCTEQIVHTRRDEGSMALKAGDAHSRCLSLGNNARGPGGGSERGG